ncbi:MAG: GntR family transcriptional regulator [Hyphomicrobium aestuarii]|nr:GntR family transcriptional regulator [Hyphomicrobium aestuarii]
MHIVRRTLHDEVAGQLRALIISGELAPGEKVPEAALAERFGVSRTPMREALKVLAFENFVKLLPNKGAIVTRLTREEIDELFPIMGALEGLAGELACRNLKLKDLVHIKRLHEAMIQCYERDDWPGYAKHNRAIHEQIFQSAGNASLSQLFEQLMLRIRSVRFTARSSPEGWLEAIKDHEEMIRALEARDGSALARTLKQHLRHKADVVERALREMERGIED